MIILLALVITIIFTCSLASVVVSFMAALGYGGILMFLSISLALVSTISAYFVVEGHNDDDVEENVR